MALDKDLKALKYDSRLKDWNLRNGVINKEEYDNYLKELPDLSNNAVQIDLEDTDSTH